MLEYLRCGEIKQNTRGGMKIEHHQIQYVTHPPLNELGGKRGIFPRGELEWHCNGTLVLILKTV